MKMGRHQLEFELGGAQECRSLRRLRKPKATQVWFEKMHQVVDEASDREPSSGILNQRPFGRAN
jgi:hypothetical protein